MMPRKPGDPAAIVIGLDCVTGLQSARILAARGVPVIGIASDPSHYCCRTNACRLVLRADTAGESLIETLESLARRLEHKAVLFPCSDLSVLAVSRHRDRLGNGYHVVLPPKDVVETLLDKVRFFEFAEAAGLPIPGTVLLRSRDDAVRAAERLAFPCVLKPPVKTPAWQSRTNAKGFVVADAAELLSTYDRCGAWSEILLAQEFIGGPISNQYTCNLYFDAASRPLVTFVTRKLRQWPPVTGTGCLAEECRNDAVAAESLRLFGAVPYRGLAYVEMKQEVDTGRLLIIEPNIGRPTGRSATAEASGVELLYTMYCDSIGRPLPENRTQLYRGVRWISLRRDALSAAWHWRHGRLTLEEWRTSWRAPRTFDVFSWKDPLPFWFDVARVLGRLTAKGARRRSGSKVSGAPRRGGLFASRGSR
jgi:predicted ATP-grasp superfamily ATP-dependent carboligase